MNRNRNTNGAIIMLMLALAVPAGAIDTPRVNLGRDGNYDGAVRVERDEAGRMIFRDGEVAAGASLRELLTGAQPEGTVRVAEQGGDFTSLAAAYEAVPEGGLILVYPGRHVLDARLTLGPKGCSIIGFDAALTTVTLGGESADIILGDDTPPSGGEDWDNPASYTRIGRFTLANLSFESGVLPAVAVVRADMTAGGVIFRSCRFAGRRGLHMRSGAISGFSTNMNISFSGCEFLAFGHEAEEAGILTANRGRGGAGDGSLVVEDCVFNPARRAPAPAARPVYSYGVLVQGTGERVTLRGGLFLDVMMPLWLNGGAGHELVAESNTIDFDNDSTGIDAGHVLGFALGGSGGSQSVRLAGNRVRLRDANPSPAGVHGLHALFTSGSGNAITSRGNDYDVPAGAGSADFGEEPGVAAYTLESCEDLWGSSAISTGTFVVVSGGDRRSGALRADALRVDGNAALGGAAPSPGATNTLVFADGAAPASSPAGAVQLFADAVSGSAELRVRDEAGNVTTLSPHTFKLFPPPADCPLPWSYYSRNDAAGLEINVDMAGLVMAVERLTGRRFIHVGTIKPDGDADHAARH